MKIIFGTTNKRKIEDLQNIIDELNQNIKVLSVTDIGWDRGDIDENGATIEENSLIKAKVIYDFCQEKEITYPIITDDAGLFCESLNGEPGIYTARYAADELNKNPELPKYQCVIKLLQNLHQSTNRKATYGCSVTCMLPDGTYFQELGESQGHIAEEIIGELKVPYFYSVFILDNYDKSFSELTKDKLDETYRYKALRKCLKKLNK